MVRLLLSVVSILGQTLLVSLDLWRLEHALFDALHVLDLDPVAVGHWREVEHGLDRVKDLIVLVRCETALVLVSEGLSVVHQGTGVIASDYTKVHLSSSLEIRAIYHALSD